MTVRSRPKLHSICWPFLLNRFATYRAALKRGVESIQIDGQIVTARLDANLVAAADLLLRRTPPSRRVRVRGKLDLLRVSRKAMGLYLDDGTLVSAIWNAEEIAALAGFLDKDVVIEGLAIFRPSGKLLRIDADAIDLAGTGDAYFSVMPLAGAMPDHRTAARIKPGISPYKELLGMIPAEESEKEFLEAIEGLG